MKLDLNQHCMIHLLYKLESLLNSVGKLSEGHNLSQNKCQ